MTTFTVSAVDCDQLTSLLQLSQNLDTCLGKAVLVVMDFNIKEDDLAF